MGQTMDRFKVYWIVVWADDLEDALKNHPEAVRICSVKTSDAKLACRECWGLVSKNMWVKQVRYMASLRNYKIRLKLLTTADGFVKIGEACG